MSASDKAKPDGSQKKRRSKNHAHGNDQGHDELSGNGMPQQRGCGCNSNYVDNFTSSTFPPEAPPFDPLYQSYATCIPHLSNPGQLPFHITINMNNPPGQQPLTSTSQQHPPHQGLFGHPGGATSVRCDPPPPYAPPYQRQMPSDFTSDLQPQQQQQQQQQQHQQHQKQQQHGFGIVHHTDPHLRSMNAIKVSTEMGGAAEKSTTTKKPTAPSKKKSKAQKANAPKNVSQGNSSCDKNHPVGTQYKASRKQKGTDTRKGTSAHGDSETVTATSDTTNKKKVKSGKAVDDNCNRMQGPAAVSSRSPATSSPDKQDSREDVSYCVHPNNLRQCDTQMKGKKRANPKQNTGSTISCLDVSLHFENCFENAAEVKKLIRSTFQKLIIADSEKTTAETLENSQAFQSEVRFKTVTLFHKSEETACEFTIPTLHVDNAKKRIRDMVVLLTETLNTSVSVSVAEAERSQKESSEYQNAHGGGIPSKNQGDTPTPLKEETAKPTSNKSKRKTKMKTKSTGPAPVAQTLLLSVEKRFHSPHLFAQFIKESMTGVFLNFSIIEQSVLMAEKSTACLIKTESKADGTRFKKAVQIIDSLRQINVNCRESSDQEVKQTAKGTDRASQIQLKLTEALFSAKEAKINTLQRHSAKISNCEQELILQTENKKGEHEYCLNPDYVAALRDQTFMLKNQRSEFLDRINVLTQSLQKKAPSTVTGKDVNAFLEAVGIECNRLDNAHPIYAHRKPILKLLKSNQLFVVSGEPGSGKSTQLIQYLYDAGYADTGIIVSIEPRESAGIGLTQKVAKDLVGRVGHVVGYKTNTSCKIDETKTRIIFTTDQCFLKDVAEDSNLQKYSCILIDDVQERTLNTDALIGVITRCIRKQKDLRVIFSVSQGDNSILLLSNYFTAMPEIRVSGGIFPVDVLYEDDTPESFENYEIKAVSQAADIHCSDLSGNILIFLKTSLEIMRCCSEFESRLVGKTDFKCIAIHEQLAQEEVRKSFEKLPQGVRKIIFATNAVENSVAFEDVRFVIDSGVKVEKMYDLRQNMRISATRAISKSSANQRKNLAGRKTGGKCYRLYSKEDFETMTETNVPEILRENLGKLLLSFEELGIAADSFDFLQTPTESAMISAVQVLADLGALEDEKITEAGTWMLRLPFDIVNNLIIYKAWIRGLAYDAVVLACLIYHNPDVDIFYSGFSDMDKENMVACKQKLQSRNGDLMTSLNVFKTWSSLSKANRASWCRQNSINYKALSFIRHSVDEILIILKDQLKIKVDKQFSNTAKAEDTLRKIMFDVNVASLSLCLDDAKNEYKSLASHHIASMHPHSHLAATTGGQLPEWIVLTNLVHDSKNYITGFVTVEKEWVRNALQSRQIRTDFTNLIIGSVYSHEVGISVFKYLVGPCFGNIWQLEKCFNDNTINKCILEGDKETRAINIYSNSAMKSHIVETLNTLKDSIVGELLHEEMDLHFEAKTASEVNELKIVIGQGGCITVISIPSLSNRILVKKAPKNVTISKIHARFKEFGQIREINKFKQDGGNQAWGSVVFGSILEAFAMVVGTTNDKHYVTEMIKGSSTSNHKPNIFEAKVSSFHDSPVDGGRAVIRCSPLDKAVLIGRCLDLSGKMCEIEVCSADLGDLIIFEVGAATEEDISEKLAQDLKAHGREPDNLRVSLIRQGNLESDTSDPESKMDILASLMKGHATEEEFHIRMPVTRYVWFVEFTDPAQGETVCREMNQRRYQIDGNEIEVSPCYGTMLRVPKIIKDACQEQLSMTVSNISHTYVNIDMEWRQMREDFVIDIISTSVEPVVMAMECLSRYIEGYVVDCCGHDNGDCILNQSGQDFLRKTEQKTGCLILTDYRNAKVHFYGSIQDVRAAHVEVNGYLSSSDETEVKRFGLQDCSKNINLFASVLHKYGPSLDKLVEECKLKSAKFDLRDGQILQAVGSATALKGVYGRLEELKENWKDLTNDQQELGFSNCSVCSRRSESGSLYRLEICNHAYCFLCLQGVVSIDLKNKAFPLACVHQDCKRQLVVKDFKFLLSKKLITETDIIGSALQASIATNGGTFNFCPGINCPMVYKTTHEVMGCEFVCPLCFVSLCTSCHKPFHRGMPCQLVTKLLKEMAPNTKESLVRNAANSLISWFSKNVTSVLTK